MYNGKSKDGFSSSPSWQKALMLISIALPLLVLIFLSSLYSTDSLIFKYPWVPSLGISFSIQLDGLSLLFIWLICGIGIFVQMYAYHYMKGKPFCAMFHLYLILFMGAMLGVVLSGNIILLFVFWELTTLTSYLLIGFNHDQENSRKNALQAILVTGAGGLALLAGLILLGQMAGSYELDHIINHAGDLSSESRFAPALILILIGAFTKSAQFPFHFWLPGAMSAPAPVSAYLHSATMVKAGVYLLARLSPVFSDSDLWFWSLAITGGVTAVWTGLLALSQKDLKLMLAYSTNVALGKLVFLLAFGTWYATSAALMFIIAHALYKAALFMVIGTVDKATGTRDLNRLAGLGSILTFSFFAAGLSALSKAGIPPLPGFVSKEYMYKAALESSYLPTAVLILVNSMMAAMAFVFVIKPFLSKPDTGTVTAKPVEKKLFLWLPPLCLAALGLFVTSAGLPWINNTLLLPAGLAVGPNLEITGLKLWQGFNLPLALSGASLLIGVAIFLYYDPIQSLIRVLIRQLPSGNTIFENIIQWTIAVASRITALLQHGRLTGYLFTLFFLLALMILVKIPELPLPERFVIQDIRFYEVLLSSGLLAAVLIVILSGSTLLSIISLGTAGFITTLFLMFYNAPDVAKTQLLVETLTVIFLVILVRRIPKLSSVLPHSTGRRFLNAMVSLVIGAGVFWTLLSITAVPQDTTLIDYFAQNSLIAAHGRNIVNVILVDFRALDTLGEITVVVMAALGASSILLAKKRRSS
ncbi:hydrogen gas-evolving membrane-bound hydrogenase subunit E [Desulfospira joergensenii]|uniref:hydrogen gas-evolving membrane-bound hydrogenase subunit E n=1 Tax=Desulfospira joergensenii TaxID=53329 RepID=UPI001FCA2051|nr:hydrogen gas-evolving membrane-bound hydrogenase subunit E [Desulfospira joergensenii]